MNPLAVAPIRKGAPAAPGAAEEEYPDPWRAVGLDRASGWSITQLAGKLGSETLRDVTLVGSDMVGGVAHQRKSGGG
eukprot:1176113-Prorocentrum_minimum.AAC.2